MFLFLFVYCLFTVYFITRPLFSLILVTLCCFLVSVSVYTYFVCLLSRSVDFVVCCWCIILFVVSSASVFTFLIVFVVCLCLLFYSLFLYLLSPFCSSVFTFPVLFLLLFFIFVLFFICFKPSLGRGLEGI